MFVEDFHIPDCRVEERLCSELVVLCIIASEHR